MGRAWVPRPKKFKTQSSAGKVMATVFWGAKGVIMLDFTQEKYNNWSVLCRLLLDQLRTVIREKRRGKLQQDNARVHTCKVARCCIAKRV